MADTSEATAGARAGEQGAGEAKPSRVSLAGLAALTIAGLAFVLCSLLTAVAVQSYRDTAAGARDRAETSAHVVAAHVQWLVGGSRAALDQIDTLLPDGLAAPTPAEQEAIRRVVARLPGAPPVALVNAAGRSTFSSAGRPTNMDVSDRPYFVALKAGDPWHISSLLVGRSSQEQLFVIAHRLERGGQFAGVALLTISSRLISEFWATLDLGAGSTVGLIREDGWLVARHPPPDGPLNLKDYVLFTDYLPKAPFGSYDAVSPADGVVRMVGYRRVEGAPLVAIASISGELALAPFWRSASRIGLILAVSLAALGVAAGWLVRLLRRDDVRKRELAAAAERNQLLLREVHHRVKNNLQVVASLVQLQPIPASARKDMGDRIAAMVAVHEQAYRTDQFAELDLAAYLETLAGNMRRSQAGQVAIVTELAPLAVDRDHALPVGLIANELVSNALKHAFPEGRAGTIAIRLKRLDDGRAELSVSDDGVGFEPSAAKKGMGSRLLRGLAAQLGDEVIYARASAPGGAGSSGSTASIRFRAAPSAR